MSLADHAIANRQSQNSAAQDIYDDGYLRIEHKNFYLSCAGQPIYLSRTEFLLLSRLARSIERVVSSQELWRYVRGPGKPFNSESLHVFIYRLRHKLVPYKLRIDTVVNVGYRLLAPPEN